MMMKFAFVFPGQGSQSVGMMQGYGDHAVIRDTFAEASDVLGQDLWRMATEPNEELNQTANTQPLMLAAGVATWRAWLAVGGAQPSMMAGHSLGEYTALVASGVLSFADALPLVRYRAEVMQSAVAEGVGAMAAILGLDDEAVRAVCAEAAQGEVLEAVNFNSPGQVVIAGNKAAVERGMEAAKVRGAKRALILPVSVPSHCALMKPAAAQLKTYLENVAISQPQVPVLHNADVAAYGAAEKIKDALVRQLYSPVRWVESVQKMAVDGVTIAAECGPGKVLAGLNKRIVAEMPCLALTGNDAMIDAKQQFGA
jgi:[acyl-carrier-protein] S-malonyltransferase